MVPDFTTTTTRPGWWCHPDDFPGANVTVATATSTGPRLCRRTPSCLTCSRPVEPLASTSVVWPVGGVANAAPPNTAIAPARTMKRMKRRDNIRGPPVALDPAPEGEKMQGRWSWRPLAVWFGRADVCRRDGWRGAHVSHRHAYCDGSDDHLRCLPVSHRNPGRPRGSARQQP